MKRCHVVLLGEPGCGKTAFLHNYLTGTFLERYEPTLGVDVRKKNITVQNANISFTFFDTAGHPTFNHVTPSSGQVYLIFCDLTKKDSLASVSYHLDKIQTVNKTENPLILLIGTKSDLKEQCVISKKDLTEKAQALKLEYAITSAKSGNSIPRVFTKIANTLVPTLPSAEENDNVVILPPKKKNKLKRPSLTKIFIGLGFLLVVVIAVLATMMLSTPLIALFLGVGLSATIAAVITHTIIIISSMCTGMGLAAIFKKIAAKFEDKQLMDEPIARKASSAKSVFAKIPPDTNPALVLKAESVGSNKEATEDDPIVAIRDLTPDPSVDEAAPVLELKTLKH